MAAGTHIFSVDDCAPAGGGVMRAHVVVHTPVAGPGRAGAVGARGVPAAVVVGELARHKVLVGLRGAHRERHGHVVGAGRHGGPQLRRRGRALQAALGGQRVTRTGVAEHTLVLGAGWQRRKSAQSDTDLKRDTNGV